VVSFAAPRLTTLYIRQPWYIDPAIQNVLLLAAPLGSLLTVVELGLLALMQRVRHRGHPEPAVRRVRSMMLVVSGLALLFIGFVVFLAPQNLLGFFV
jgi:hypothetical protein